MRKLRWGITLSALLIMNVTAPLIAAEGTQAVQQIQDETVLTRALMNLDLERDSWAQSYDWGPREEYPQRLVEYNEQMKAFQLERLQLQLELYRLQGDEAAFTRTEHNIDQLVNGIECTPQVRSEDMPGDRDRSPKGGIR